MQPYSAANEAYMHVMNTVPVEPLHMALLMMMARALDRRTGMVSLLTLKRE